MLGFVGARTNGFPSTPDHLFGTGICDSRARRDQGRVAFKVKDLMLLSWLEVWPDQEPKYGRSGTTDPVRPLCEQRVGRRELDLPCEALVALSGTKKFGPFGNQSLAFRNPEAV